jgi:trk system potassium uptake protein TrkH
LPDAAKLVLMVSMGVGGDMGSTAGGIKILRLLIVLYLVRTLIVRTCVPEHALLEPRIAGRRRGSREISAAVAIVALFSSLTLASWMPFLLLGHPPFDALFEVVSALATCGLSAGITGPDLHPVLKFVLCVDMLMGRVEICAFAILFYYRTWIGRTAGDA